MPSFAISAVTSSPNSISIPSASMRFLTSPSIIDAIFLMSSSFRRLKTMISSIRLSSSGLKSSLSCAVTRFLISSASFARELTSSEKPSLPPLPVIDDAPTLLVRIITVFLKSTFLPWESVRTPSSSTWRRMLNTSGCAFSISSNKTTEYGRRRIFSVSCPPSS